MNYDEYGFEIFDDEWEFSPENTKPQEKKEVEKKPEKEPEKEPVKKSKELF